MMGVKRGCSSTNYSTPKAEIITLREETTKSVELIGNALMERVAPIHLDYDAPIHMDHRANSLVYLYTKLPDGVMSKLANITPSGVVLLR